MVKRYLIYLLRWQLSTPILAVCVAVFASFGSVISTIIANLIGGLLFFWIDRLIFSKKYKNAVWSVKPKAICADCGAIGRSYRLVESGTYDRSTDPDPQYRCESCSVKKCEQLSARGVLVV